MKKLYRSKKNKKISGLCGGLGDYFAIDPTFVRLLMLALLIFTGILPLLIGYLIASLIIPVEPKSHVVKRYKRLYRSKKDRKLSGVLGGVANFFKIDSTLVRVIYIILLFVTAVFPLLICYFVAAVIIPEKPSNTTIEIEVDED